MSASLVTHERFTDIKDKDGQRALGKPILKGLQDGQFMFLTEVQRLMVPAVLRGEHVLTQALTGSGKTLGYAIPIAQRLWREGRQGPTAMVVLPTKDLAIQVFNVFSDIGGSFASTSIGLIVGGKKVKEDKKYVRGLNLIIGTPGRIIQHMRETPGFDVGSLQMLVLDEVDRLVDQSFIKDTKAILHEHGNPMQTRQLILCSATAEITDQQLRTLRLKRSAFTNVEAGSGVKTAGLTEMATVVRSKDKASLLFSFLIRNVARKSLVFVETNKMVRYLGGVGTYILPRLKVFQLGGHQSLQKRLDTFNEFSQYEGGAVLFATDVAERGIDVPNLRWVIQFDPPANTDTYVHRVGRTARLNATGSSVLFLRPVEVGLVKTLEEKVNTKIKWMKPDLAKIRSFDGALRHIWTRDSYLQSIGHGAVVHQMKTARYKDFDPDEAAAFERSLGVVDAD